MPSFIFGQFEAGDSIVHQLDARSKFLSLLFMIVLSLLSGSNWLLLILTAVVFCALKLSRVSLRQFFRGIRLFIFMILITAVLQLLFSRGGHVYAEFGFLQLTQLGLHNMLLSFLRFFIAIVMMALFLLTTSPTAITDAVIFFLSPLKIFKLPVSDIGLTLSIALRFVPTMVQSFSTIIDAQKSRGAVFNQGSLIKRLKMVVPVMAPLLLTSVKRAEDLAAAMIMRGYTDGRHRSRFRVMQWHSRDTVLMLAWIPVIFVILYVISSH